MWTLGYWLGIRGVFECWPALPSSGQAGSRRYLAEEHRLKLGLLGVLLMLQLHLLHHFLHVELFYGAGDAVGGVVEDF